MPWWLTLNRDRCGTQRVKANNIYQDYIRDRSHLHMNATRWVTLTGFIQHLGQAGIVRVEDTEKGLFISWIDNSPKALAKAVSTSLPILNIISIILTLTIPPYSTGG